MGLYADQNVGGEGEDYRRFGILPQSPEPWPR
jgi:hypothetical protein